MSIFITQQLLLNTDVLILEYLILLNTKFEEEIYLLLTATNIMTGDVTRHVTSNWGLAGYL